MALEEGDYFVNLITTLSLFLRLNSLAVEDVLSENSFLHMRVDFIEKGIKGLNFLINQTDMEFTLILRISHKQREILEIAGFDKTNKAIFIP